MNKIMQLSENLKLFKKGFIACIPTLFGYWAVGFACGAIGAVSGFNTLQIFALSLFLYAGSAQFLFYSLMATGAGYLQIGLAIAFINMRYLLINTYMAQFFSKAPFWQKVIGGALMTDETFGVASQYAKRHNNQLPFAWLLGLNLTAWFNWTFSTTIGALFATALPAWLRDSLSFSLVGMFVGLLLLGFYASHTKKIDSIVIVIAMAIIIISQGLLDTNLAIIAATIIAAFIGMLFLIKREKAKSS